jgi:hypothetical protein
VNMYANVYKLLPTLAGSIHRECTGHTRENT